MPCRRRNYSAQLKQLVGEFDFVINATSASLTGDTLQLPECLVFTMPMKWLMANLRAF
jgi:hypothetical protein